MVKRLLVLLLLWTMAGLVAAQEETATPAPPEGASQTLPTPMRHLVLLDVSGSMRNRGYAVRGPDGQTHWQPPLPDFVRRLLTGFPGADEVVVLPFSEAVTDAKEHRAPTDPTTLLNLSAVVEKLPAPGGGATNMTYALDRAMPLYAPGGTTLIWLITDNENNVDTQQNDQEFYERLSGQAAGHEKDYSHVIFFPIATGQVHGALKDNLVMYLLIPGTGERPWVDALMEQVKRTTGFAGVIFRPLYADPGRPVLDFSKELKVQGRGPKVRQEGGTTVLTFEEGDTLRGKLAFKVRSHLKGWKIEDATLDDASVDLQIPSGYEAAGNQQLVWEINPKKLSVEPEKESADFYLLDLAGARLKTPAAGTPTPGPGGVRKPAAPARKAGPLVLARSWGKFLGDPFASYLPTIGGQVKVTATLKLAPEDIEKGSIKPAFEEEVKKRVESVTYLADIERFMVLQSDLPGMTASEQDNTRTITFERKLAIRVKANPLGAMLALAGLAALLLGGLALLLALTVWKAHYELAGPEGTEEFSLPYLWGAWLISGPGGQPLATLEQRLGALRVHPEPDCVCNGAPEVQPVDWETSEVRLELAQDGKPVHHYTLTRGRGPGRSNLGQEDGPSL